MALRPLCNTVLTKVAERVDHVAPVGVVFVQLDVEAVDRRVDFRVDTMGVTLGTATTLGAKPEGFIDHDRDQLRHALERRGLVGGQGCECEEVLQERLLERQRALASYLQVERVELETRCDLHGHEDRFVFSHRAERLLNKPHEAFGRPPDIRLADQRHLRAIGPHHRR